MKMKIFEVESFEDLVKAIKSVCGTPIENNPSKESKDTPCVVKTPKKSDIETKKINEYKQLVLESIAKKRGWPEVEVNKWLYKLSLIYPMVAADIVLIELSRILDNRYTGTINSCEKVFLISRVNGKVYEVNSNIIKSFRNIPAFRTREDAEFARKVISIRKLLRSGKGK